MSETQKMLADDPDEVILLLNDPDSVGRALPLCIATECIEKLQRALTQAQADLGLERESHEVTKRMLNDADHELIEGRARCAEVEKDASRYRFVRDLLAIEDIERLIADGNPTPDEQESVQTDAAIDAALKVPR